MDLQPNSLKIAVSSNKPIILKNCRVLYKDTKFVHNGWDFTETFLKSDVVNDQKYDFCTFVERYFNWEDYTQDKKPFKREWIGIIHDPIDSHLYEGKNKNKLDLKKRGFINSLVLCKKLYLLTKNETEKWRKALNKLGFSKVEVGTFISPNCSC